jgi:excisionase family DNA binding protein
MENLFNVNQAAYILKVHPLTVRRYIKENKLKAVKVGGNIRIKESQLMEFNKDLIPRAAKPKTQGQDMRTIKKTFTSDDPLFRLKRLGAHVELSNRG